MAKRFIDTNIIDKEWFMELDAVEQAAWFYIICKCDAVGVYETNRIIENAVLGKSIDFDTLIEKSSDNLEYLTDKKIFIINYCNVQYGESIKNVSSNSAPIKSHHKLLRKHGLFERVCLGLVKGLDSLKEKEQEKAKVKKKDEEEDKFKFKEKEEEKEPTHSFNAIRSQFKAVK